jgi:hypothetical protein
LQYNREGRSPQPKEFWGETKDFEAVPAPGKRSAGCSIAIPPTGRWLEFRIIPKMFHVKHFGPVAQNLTRQKTEILLGKVWTARILVQLKSAGEGVSLA